MMQDRGVLWRARLGKGSGGGGLCVLSNQGQTARRLDGWLNFVVTVVRSLSRVLSNQGQTARRLDGWLNFVVMAVGS